MKTTLQQVRMIVREALLQEEAASAFEPGTLVMPLERSAPIFDSTGMEIGETTDMLTVGEPVELDEFSLLSVDGEDFLISAADFKKAPPVSEGIAMKILAEQRARKKALVEHGCGCAKCAQKATGRPYGMGAFMYDLLVAGEENELDEEDTVEES